MNRRNFLKSTVGLLLLPAVLSVSYAAPSARCTKRATHIFVYADGHYGNESKLRHPCDASMLRLEARMKQQVILIMGDMIDEKVC